MTKVIDLVRQGRNDDVWKMCCGYLRLDVEQFMGVQERLLLDQMNILRKSRLGSRLLRGSWPLTIEEFRNNVPITTYKDYCPELSEKQEETLPAKPAEWVHTSGRSGEYACKWVPMTQSFIDELGPVLYGLGLISAGKEYGDAPLVEVPNMMYTVAPRPWISGALASILQEQTPARYYPSLSQAELMSFEDRIKQGFAEALNGDIDYFFGLSLVLAAVGTKFSQSNSRVDIKPLFKQPKALMRLTRGMIKSRLAGRTLLPKDLWKVKGIITSGLDSSVYRNKIMEFWGRYPLDIYANTEGGVIATQTWDYEGMTFIPNLNFLEFIPEKEHFKLKLDPSYQPGTLLFDEIQPGECYEIVITSLHGGSLVRYRIGDIVRIISLKNSASGINTPQMVFERRADDLLDFATFRLNEKSVWQAIEKTGFAYEDWAAYKTAGELTLNILIEPKKEDHISEIELEDQIYRQIQTRDDDTYTGNREQDYLTSAIKFKLKIRFLPRGTYAAYSAQKQAEGADFAHLKPPHINPPPRVMSALLPEGQLSVPKSLIYREKKPVSAG